MILGPCGLAFNSLAVCTSALFVIYVLVIYGRAASKSVKKKKKIPATATDNNFLEIQAPDLFQWTE